MREADGDIDEMGWTRGALKYLRFRPQIREHHRLENAGNSRSLSVPNRSAGCF
jgi:hypothetical protein